ncbi:SdiA-regulated domain-containing protein, partial [Pseudomonas syringae pv. tagetis]
LAYVSRWKRRFVALERDPVQIMEGRGFHCVFGYARGNLQVITDGNRDGKLSVRYLSILEVDEASGLLLALSVES